MIIQWYGTSNTGVTQQEHVHQIMRRVFNCIKSEEANEERGREGERERGGGGGGGDRDYNFVEFDQGTKTNIVGTQNLRARDKIMNERERENG